MFLVSMHNEGLCHGLSTDICHYNVHLESLSLTFPFMSCLAGHLLLISDCSATGHVHSFAFSSSVTSLSNHCPIFSSFPSLLSMLGHLVGIIHFAFGYSLTSNSILFKLKGFSSQDYWSSLLQYFYLTAKQRLVDEVIFLN